MNDKFWASVGALGLGIVLFCAAPARSQTPGAAFGAPPSGEIPIFFNDRHVYAKPDRVRNDRVLAALVRGDTVLVPLRSLFERTGATVSYDPATRTVVVSKVGAEVKVTLGKPVASINGEERLLDVPPEIYRGTLVVPLRVISEGMGAYVQWVPEKKSVVVRYNAAPAAPTPVPTVEATAAPTLVPTAAPASTAAPTPPPATPLPYERFVSAAYLVSPSVYNEISPGNDAQRSYALAGGFEFPLVGERWMLEAQARHLAYDHRAYGSAATCAAGTVGCNTVVGSDPRYQPGSCPSSDPGCVTVIGYRNVVAYDGLGQAFVPAFSAREDDVDVRFGLDIAKPRVYVGIGGFFKRNDYLAYPTLSGIGAGLEKLPDLENPASLYGNVWYYPNVSGTYAYPDSIFLGPLRRQSISLSYAALKYAVGATIGLGHGPLYVDLGYAGESLRGKNNAPGDTSVASPFVGLGLHF